MPLSVAALILFYFLASCKAAFNTSHFLVKSGTCESHGLSWITDTDPQGECTKAGIYLDQLYPDVKALVLNCGSSGTHCLCKFTGPTCDTQDGSLPHSSSPRCFCGDNDIARCDGSQLYCNSASGRAPRCGCPPGFYATSATACTECDASKYSTSISSSCPYTADSCPAGTYSTGTAACEMCPPGQFSVGGAVESCRGCPQGQFTRNATRSCEDCAAGKYSNSASNPAYSCINCPSGKYSTPMSSTCTYTAATCPAGTFAVEPAACSGSCPAGQFPLGDQCQTCGKGTIANAGAASTGCVGCTSGKYQSQNAASSYSCSTCSEGTVALNASSECATCSSGQYQDKDSASSYECKTCGKGQVAPSILFSCSECVSGRYQNLSIAPSSACAECGPGMFAPNKTSPCATCTHGQYMSNASNFAYHCSSCGIGRSSLSPSQNCTVCAIGTFQAQARSTAYGCYACGKGTVSRNISSPCAACPEGRFQNQERATSTSCKSCGPGRVTADARTACAGCSPGRYQAQEAASAYSCSTCTKGYATSDSFTACKICAFGRHQDKDPADSYTCKICDIGRFANKSGESEGCFPCPAGKHLIQNGTYDDPTNHDDPDDCVPCPPLTYNDRPGLGTQCFPCSTAMLGGAEACRGCEPGQITVEGSADCQNCLPGRFSDSRNERTCQNCSAGLYQEEAGKKSCDLCGRGTWNNMTGATNGTEACRACPAGQFSEINGVSQQNLCKLCPAGRWSDVLGAVKESQCQPCRAGRYVEAPGRTSMDTCVACPKGTHGETPGARNISQCVACPKGTHASRTASTSCFPCIPGKANREKAQSECLNCEEGQYRAGDGDDPESCDACPKGFYQKSEGQASCLPCLPGEFGNITGMKSCHKCGVGTVSETAASWNCTDCKIGSFSNAEGSAKCTPCGAGTYSNVQGQDCQNCDKGQYRAGDDTDPKSCDDCSKGFYQKSKGQASCFPCLPGEFGNETGMTSCHKCPEGTEKESEGPSDCTLCIAGRYAGNRGRVSCLPCVPGRITTQEGATVCVDCDPGDYASNEAMIACLKCPEGKGSTKGSAKCGDCTAGKRKVRSYTGEESCVPCAQGKYQPTAGMDSCSDCKLGFYQKLEGSASCLPCLPGEFGNSTGMTSCHKCDIGMVSGAPNSTSCSECEAGRSSDTKGNAKCTSCGAGKFSDEQGSAKCTSCPRGFTCEGSGSLPRPCDPGTYAFKNGSSSCFPCSPGKFSPKPGSRRCTDCPSGWFQDLEGRENCSEPSKGSIAVKGGTIAVKIPPGSEIDPLADSGFTACEAGTFEVDSECRDCPPGTSSSRGAQICRNCPKGRFTELGGSLCKSCPSGYFQAKDSEPSLHCESCPLGWGPIYDRQGEALNGSPVCHDLQWKTADDCNANEFLDDDVDENYAATDVTCKPCPKGGACAGPISFNRGIPPLFGWWKVPKGERTSRLAMFVPCVYAPACLGGANHALAGQFLDENDKHDLALVALAFAPNNKSSSNATADNIAALSTCSEALGFQLHSRLCHACNSTSRRLGNNRCTICPGKGQNWTLMVLGALFGCTLLAFIVSSTIQDAGKQALSTNVQKILLNYLQIAGMAQAFPLNWPPALQSLFEFQSIVSTIGESLVNPDCVAESRGAALFYQKQAGFATTPFLATAVAFAFWFVRGYVKGTPFFAKRASIARLSGEPVEEVSTPKDKFVVTVCVVLYMIYPTLCKRAFEMFNCKTIAGVQYLRADLEARCYEGDHLVAVLTLGLGQLLIFVIGGPALVLAFLRRNRRHPGGGLSRHVVMVRFGLFYSDFTDSCWYWEGVLTARKIAIVAISVFGVGLGTERQAQCALFILMVCISAQIAASPLRAGTVQERSLGRLELASLFTLWMTMWCGTLIFASPGPEDTGLVIFLSLVVAVMTVGILVWLVGRLLVECREEKKNSKLANLVNQTLLRMRIGSIRSGSFWGRNGHGGGDRDDGETRTHRRHSHSTSTADLDAHGIEMAANPFAMSWGQEGERGGGGEDGEEAPPSPCRRVASFVFVANDNDEVDLAEGDVIEAVKDAGDGWSVGRNARTGIEGYFPTSFAE